MVIFISHNSLDKVKALRLRDSLVQDGHTVWMDTFEISYGDTIAESIVKGLEQADLMVVLWSENSSGSRGVAHEISYARDIRKRIIFCKLDKTRVPPHDGQFGDLSMHFYNFQSGLVVLRGEIMEMEYQAMSGKDATLDEMMPVQREASKLHEHFSRTDLRGSTKNEDKAAMLRQCLQMYMKVPSVQQRPDSQGAFAFLNALLDDLESNIDSPSGLVQVQKTLQASPYANHKIGLMVQHTIASVLSESGTTPASPPNDTSVDHIQSTIDAYARQFETLFQESKGLLARAVQENFPGSDAQILTMAIQYYLSSSASQLESLHAQAVQSKSPALQRARDQLIEYLRRPDDLIDDSAGIWGFFDDVWLIQNVVYRCIEAGLMPSTPLDWQRIETGDAVVLGLFNTQVTHALQSYLAHILEEIQQHLPTYQPQVNYDPQVPYASMNGIHQASSNALLQQAFATMLLHGMMSQQQQPQGGQCWEDQVVAMGFGSLL